MYPTERIEKQRENLLKEYTQARDESEKFNLLMKIMDIDEQLASYKNIEEK